MYIYFDAMLTRPASAGKLALKLRNQGTSALGETKREKDGEQGMDPLSQVCPDGVESLKDEAD